MLYCTVDIRFRTTINMSWNNNSFSRLISVIHHFLSAQGLTEILIKIQSKQCPTSASPPLRAQYFCRQREWEKKTMWNRKNVGFSWAAQRSIYHLVSSKNRLLICCHLPLLLQPTQLDTAAATLLHIISTLNHALNNCLLYLVFIFSRDWGHPALLYWKGYGSSRFSIFRQILLYFPDFEGVFFLKFRSSFGCQRYCRLLNVNQPTAVVLSLETN